MTATQTVKKDQRSEQLMSQKTDMANIKHPCLKRWMDNLREEDQDGLLSVKLRYFHSIWI